MRVLVLWADSRSDNLGVRVLAQGMAALARMAWGDDTEVDYQDFGPGDSETGFGGRTIVRDLFARRGPIRSKLGSYDVILDSGAGDSFTDMYGLKRLLIMHYAHRATSRVGVPLVFGPQTVGPFSSALSRRIARDSLARTRAVFARDELSATVAAKLGAAPLRATDVVFALPPPPPPAGQRDVVMNVSGLLWEGFGRIEKQAYRDSVADTIVRLSDDGRRVTLLPHVLDNPTADSDVRVTEELGREFADRVEVVVPDGLDDARTILAGARLAIGSRMHLCLNALSVGTPAIAWAYSDKFGPLLKDLGWPHVVDLRTDPGVVDRTLRLAGGSDAMRESLQSVNARARDRLSEAARLMSELV